jgi:hypothetical protein
MYGVITTVPGPIEMYDAVHAEMVRRVGASIDGLHVHVGRATSDGFQVLEVWESKEHYDRANADIVFPVMRELAGDQPLPPIEQGSEVFDIRGLVLPGSGTAV